MKLSSNTKSMPGSPVSGVKEMKRKSLRYFHARGEVGTNDDIVRPSSWAPERGHPSQLWSIHSISSSDKKMKWEIVSREVGGRENFTMHPTAHSEWEGKERTARSAIYIGNNKKTTKRKRDTTSHGGINLALTLNNPPCSTNFQFTWQLQRSGNMIS